MVETVFSGQERSFIWEKGYKLELEWHWLLRTCVWHPILVIIPQNSDGWSRALYHQYISIRCNPKFKNI